MHNEGYSPEAIKTIREKAKKAGKSFVISDSMERTPESVAFYFVGQYEGKAVVFDACMFSLRLEHEMEVYREAEDRVCETYPEFNLEEEMEHNEDSEAMELFDDIVAEIEEAQDVTVSEFIDFDETVEFGVGLDVCLNVKEITDKVIAKFIEEFNNGTFEPDPKEYFFSLDEFED